MSPKITEAHRESKRKEILDAAVRVFIRQGYRNTTMKDVVEESGLSRGGVYLYFSSTEEMLLAVIEDIDRENDKQIDELLAQYPTVWMGLSALFDHLQEELLHIEEGLIPVLYEAMMAGWRKKTYEDLLNVRYAIALDRIAAMLQRGVNRGEFQPIVPLETIARMFITINDGIMVGATQFGTERMQIAEQVAAIRQSFAHLLGVREEVESE